MKYYLLLLSFLTFPIMLFSQENLDEFKSFLTKGKYRQFRVTGTESHLGAKSCENGEGFYTFYKEGIVIIKECKHLSWMTKTLDYSISKEDDEFIIKIGSIQYVYKKLTSEAPVCKKENCIRLSNYAPHADEYSTNIYLTY